jgi:hypothetical protein
VSALQASSSRRVLVRRGLGFLSVVLGLTGLIGALHMPWARPLLMQVGGCPVVTDPIAIERARHEGALARRGTEPAPTRIVRGFRLGEDSSVQVQAWANAHEVRCTSEREGTWLLCENVPASALGMSSGPMRVDFTFRSADNRLLSVATYRQAPDVSANAEAFRAAAADLEALFGDPTFRGGEPGGTEAYATATIAYRYSDLVIDLTNTAIPTRGSSVLESYVLATD